MTEPRKSRAFLGLAGAVAVLACGGRSEPAVLEIAPGRT